MQFGGLLCSSCYNWLAKVDRDMGYCCKQLAGDTSTHCDNYTPVCKSTQLTDYALLDEKRPLPLPTKKGKTEEYW